jgi:lysophospholipase L1-like esterase
MKFFIIALCAMGLPFAACAQTGAPSAETGSAAQPPSTTTPDNARYLNDPKLLIPCATRLTAFTDKTSDIVFIGDSTTEGWLTAGKEIWDRLYAPRHAFNFGVHGDMTQNVLWRLNNMDISNLKPKVAVVLIGTNNLANNPHEIADGIKEILGNTQEFFPGVKIILVSILPNGRANDKMMQVNSPTLPDGTIDSSFTGLASDHLNLTAAGYQIWADAMEPVLAKLGLK